MRRGCTASIEDAMIFRALFAAALLGATALSPALADPVEDFYAGKQIKFIVRSPPGTTYDQYTRLLARHLTRHIPGKPQNTIVLMPGAGGITAANYLANVAPRDGTVLSIVGQGLVVDQALQRSSGLRANLKEFGWIGNLGSFNQVLVTWHTSPTKTLADALARTTVVGSTGAGSVSQQMPSFYNAMLGTKLKLVYGYPDPTAINLAMERGEVEANASNIWVRYKVETPHYIADKLIHPIIQVGEVKEPDLPDVPLLKDLAKKAEDKPLFEFMSASVAVGRPLATTPGVPAERIAALVKAFDETMQDPAFLADVENQRADVRPMDAADLTRLVNELIDAPDDIRRKVITAVQAP
jgi:tripartite-type tricarboxylate transporter receptor subunit TctC